MAVLTAEIKRSWTQALKNCRSKWVILAVPGGESPLQQLAGMAGLIDWHLHGQVSSLISRGLAAPDEFCLIPETKGRHTSFLIYCYGAELAVKPVVSKLKKLGIEETCLAESTFPTDFLPKLKQNLHKEGIRCTKLEPEN